MNLRKLLKAMYSTLLERKNLLAIYYKVKFARTF